jgi:hypothetical protein
MSYIGNSPEIDAAVNKYEYTATSGQTTFNCVYDSRVDVFLNGVLLSLVDYTATSGVNIVLTVGATIGDTVQIDAFQNIAVMPVISTIFPFYKADGTSDTIAITSGEFPFFKADGSADNIGVS